ncbi:hypothetical protein NUU61_009935 [Penicillium alfredii]|uniref:Zn(2)-C6 fungal-type domain-containing protein n=1 Tax=Penicillium alfredii TaxID=1506179 RepID=A0A9W9EH73_9EURO|nr:uncharacterized protein NUU61_009935 [Penicillium alfredii]KAJ5081671.1 hypothetical protein NUU61_009935 [Penicillium alfredii]
MNSHVEPRGPTERAPVPHRSSAPRVRLSCEACRQRKVKCDKLSPCTSCQRLGFVCVPVERARLPRGRARRSAEKAFGSDKELADRVAKLEKLLKTVANERDSDSGHGVPPSVAPSDSIPEHPPAPEIQTQTAYVESRKDQTAMYSVSLPYRPRPRPPTAYMGSSFWEDIMQQTQELRTVLDDRLENAQPDFSDPSGFGHSLVSSESPESTTNSPQSNRGITLLPSMRSKLCDIYLHNVDPLFKILHGPSLSAFLRDGRPYLDYEPEHQAPATLASAVYCAAVCTLSEEECLSLFAMEKRTVVADFQRETEAALARADFVTTNDVTVLQAYVLSLLAARSQDQSRRVWTMLSMALRVGQALSLHIPDPPFFVPPFDLEIRKRVWLGIGMLDVAASLDRASEPMMQSAWLESHSPANINDEDIWFGMDGPIPEHKEGTFTDMSHTLVIAASQSVTRSIAFADFIEPSVGGMGLRQQLVQDFQQTALSLLSGCEPEVSAFQWFAKKSAGIMSSWLQLVCLRPLQRSKSFTPPAIQGDALLRLAADNLQWSQEVYTHPATTPWQWFGCMWVPWHGLAVAIAELCVCKDPLIMSKYWALIESVYQRSRFLIADSQHGMLWKPMEKLMTQARTRKRELLGPDPDPLVPKPTFPQFPYSVATESTPGVPQVQSTPAEFSSLGLETTAAPPLDPATTMPPLPPFSVPDSWPNVWDAMDLSTSGLQPSGDTAWLNYENFIGDVYNSVDSMFLPR